MPGLSSLKLIASFQCLSLLVGCGGGDVEEPVGEHAIVGSWSYVPSGERDDRRLEITFYRVGRYDQVEEREMLSGQWRLAENDQIKSPFQTGRYEDG